MKITYRLLTQEDAPLLSKWLEEPAVMRNFPMANSIEIADAVRIILSYAKLNAAFGCELEGELVGATSFYLQGFQKLKHHALVMVIVSPAMRGKGIGTHLMEYTLEQAKKELSLSLINLEVYEGNPAERLYRRLGFTELGRHERFLKDGDEYITKICMEKRI